jgi:hypothetical protein
MFHQTLFAFCAENAEAIVVVVMVACTACMWYTHKMEEMESRLADVLVQMQRQQSQHARQMNRTLCRYMQLVKKHDVLKKEMDSKNEKRTDDDLQTLLSAQASDAGRIMETLLAKQLLDHTSFNAFLNTLNNNFIIDHQDEQVASHCIDERLPPTRVKAYATADDWLEQFVAKRDTNIVSFPPNCVGPDIALFVNEHTLLLMGVKTSCSGKGVANCVLRDNALTTQLDNMFTNKRNHGQELVWKKRFDELMQANIYEDDDDSDDDDDNDNEEKDDNSHHRSKISHVIRVHVCMPYVAPKRKVVESFSPGDVHEQFDKERGVHITSMDFDQACLSMWISEDVMTVLNKKFIV